MVSLTRALTRAEGLRIRSGASHTFVSRLREVAVSGALDRTLGPMRAMLELLDEELDRIDRELTDDAHEDGEIARLMTVPGIGPITATAFVSAIDDVAGFAGQPGDQLRGAGASRIQLGGTDTPGTDPPQCATARPAPARPGGLVSLAVQRRRQRSAPAWADSLSLRRGKRVAVIGLARRLAGSSLRCGAIDGATTRRGSATCGCVAPHRHREAIQPGCQGWRSQCVKSLGRT